MSAPPATDMEPEHRPNDKYVSEMPSMPRIQLLHRYSPSPYASEPRSSLISPNFLRGIDLNSCLQAAEKQDLNWCYEFRYAAQKILPFLYLGPTSCARNANFLQAAGITMILTVRIASPLDDKPLNSALTNAHKLGVRTPVLDVRTDRHLISIFPAATSTINDHMDERNANISPSNHDEIASAVLVCCDSGSHRSAAVVIAYIMETFGLALLPAYRIVQDHRFCIAVDDATKQTLLTYETILEARRNVVDSLDVENQFTAIQSSGQANGNSLLPSFRVSKRVREAESDVGVEEADDRARFEGRTFIPFNPD